MAGKFVRRIIAAGRKRNPIRLLAKLRRLEDKNPSRARELFARKIALPVLKKIFGNNLFAVLLVGSSQVGVRAAEKNKSDCDIIVVVRKNYPYPQKSLDKALEDIKVKMTKHRIVFDFHLLSHKINPELSEVVVNKLTLQSGHLYQHGSPFQVIYGSRFNDEITKFLDKDKINAMRKDYLRIRENRNKFQL